MPEPRKRGPLYLREEEAESRFNLKLPNSLREKLEAEARETGISPTELIRRRIEGAPVSAPNDSMREMVRAAMQEMQSGQLCLPFDEVQKQQLEDVAARIGFLDAPGFAKAMILRAIKDPEFVESLLTNATINGFKASAQAEIEATKPKRRKAA